jgi:hypothetical protein
MISDSALDAVCQIPQAYRGGKSPWAAVRQSGYKTVRDQITPTDLAQYLSRHPQFIEDWELYSLDKRTSGGWYLLRNERGWTVGSVSVSHPDEQFESAAEACAHFVLREVETIFCIVTFRKPRWPKPLRPGHRDVPSNER